MRNVSFCSLNFTCYTMRTNCANGGKNRYMLHLFIATFGEFEKFSSAKITFARTNVFPFCSSKDIIREPKALIGYNFSQEKAKPD